MSDTLGDTDFGDCSQCGSTEYEQHLIDGKCKACYALSNETGTTVEVPVAVLEKLAGMARTRHPSVCNEDAYQFSNVLDNSIDEFSWGDE